MKSAKTKNKAVIQVKTCANAQKDNLSFKNKKNDLKKDYQIAGNEKTRLRGSFFSKSLQENYFL